MIIWLKHGCLWWPSWCLHLMKFTYHLLTSASPRPLMHGALVQMSTSSLLNTITPLWFPVADKLTVYHRDPYLVPFCFWLIWTICLVYPCLLAVKQYCMLMIFNCFREWRTFTISTLVYLSNWRMSSKLYPGKRTPIQLGNYNPKKVKYLGLLLSSINLHQGKKIVGLLYYHNTNSDTLLH